MKIVRPVISSNEVPYLEMMSMEYYGKSDRGRGRGMRKRERRGKRGNEEARNEGRSRNEHKQRSSSAIFFINIFMLLLANSVSPNFCFWHLNFVG